MATTAIFLHPERRRSEIPQTAPGGPRLPDGVRAGAPSVLTTRAGTAGPPRANQPIRGEHDGKETADCRGPDGKFPVPSIGSINVPVKRVFDNQARVRNVTKPALRILSDNGGSSLYRRGRAGRQRTQIGCVLEDRSQTFRCRRTGERAPPCEELDEHAAECPDVGALVA